MDKGTEREKKIPIEKYFADAYFSKHQLSSLFFQLSTLYSMRPGNLLEIGLGNGIVSDSLKKAHVKVTTYDINQSLKPDIADDISNVRKHFKKNNFDVVSCCEVLEHLPFSEFENNLKRIKEICSNKILFTFPCSWKAYGIHLRIKFPRFNREIIFFPLKIKKNINEQHFWEMGSSKETSIKGIYKILKKYFNVIDRGYIPGNPLHYYYIVTKIED